MGEEHASYWGTRQQLLAGKVICDWLCEDDKPPMDPIFGVLLNPTAGRVGPGDSGWFHNLLYDNAGEWAHHSCLLYTSPSPRDGLLSRMPSSA